MEFIIVAVAFIVLVMMCTAADSKPRVNKRIKKKNYNRRN